MRILKESTSSFSESSNWLQKIGRKAKEIKAKIKDDNQIDEALLTEDIYSDLEEGTHFRVNDNNRSVYQIFSFRDIGGDQWAVFGSRHSNANRYAVLLSDLEEALNRNIIKILSEDEYNNWKLRKGNEEL